MQNLAQTHAKNSTYIPYGIVVCTLIVYFRVIWHDFINFDDFVFVVENTHVNTGISLENLYWAFTTGHQGNWIPLTWISHQLDVTLFGLHAGGHHAINVILHSINGVLLYSFLNRVSASPWKSATVALFFALHPLHVESVAWIAERKDVLSTFFMMFALNIYLKYALENSKKMYITTLILFTCGILSKSMLVTFPVLLLLLDYWPLNRFRNTPFLKLCKEKVPFIIISFACAVITYKAHSALDAITELYTFDAKAGKAALAYLTYLYKMIWPTKLALIYTYSLYPPAWQTIIAALAALSTITLTAVYFRKYAPYIMTGWLWYCITLFPVSGIIQIGMHSIADRYTYIPYTGIFILAVWGITDIFERCNLPRQALTILFIAIIIILATITYRQLGYWQNTTTIFGRTLAVTENNWVAHTILGSELEKTGKFSEAVDHYIAATKAKPTYAVAHLKLGHIYGKLEATRAAIESHVTGLRYEPGNAEAQYNLGYLYLQDNNIEKAREQHQKLLELGKKELAATLMQNINIAKNQLPVKNSPGQP